jgi:hypothetical protein
MKAIHHPATLGGGSAADLPDIAALDRLAGQLAPQATLRRYGRQRTAGGARTHGGWQRLWAAVRSH